jgi:hypothetical protein
VDQAIEDGIGKSRIADDLVPVLDRQLAGDDGRATPKPIFQNLQHLSALLGNHGRKTPIIEDQELDAHQAFEQACVAAVALSQG